MDEIFEMIKKQIFLMGFNSAIGVKFFITGGGSNLMNISSYCSNFFLLTVEKIKKNKTMNSRDVSDENFSSCFGAIKLIKDGCETEAIPETSGKYSDKRSFLDRLFGRRI